MLTVLTGSFERGANICLHEEAGTSLKVNGLFCRDTYTMSDVMVLDALFADLR